MIAHVCAWEKAEDERFQVCGCGMWRWSPAYSQKVADEAHRKCQNGPREPIQPISATFGPEVTGECQRERGRRGMSETEPTTVRHNVGTCPACRAYLWAEVDLTVKADAPTLSREGEPRVFAHARATAMRLTHECRAEDDA